MASWCGNQRTAPAWGGISEGLPLGEEGGFSGGTYLLSLSPCVEPGCAVPSSPWHVPGAEALQGFSHLPLVGHSAVLRAAARAGLAALLTAH